ncbi:MAG: hypothetical protein KF842_04635 [Caulobacter sp.]|nr:hypothetical protein [Caulobacter sp.]
MEEPDSEPEGEAVAPPQTPPPVDTHRRKWAIGAATALALILVFNLTAWAPVAAALAKDERNHAAGIHVYRAWFVHPRDITVNLVTLGDAATIDLTRELFQTAEALKDRKFGKVTLSRGGKAVFVMAGEDFAELGAEYGAGQNPVYLIRTLPQKLTLPDGRSAFGTWEGGWLGVLGKQMEDANSFGQAWATGDPPSLVSAY